MSIALGKELRVNLINASRPSASDRYWRQAAVADRGAERSHSAGAGTGFGLRPALAVADEPRRNGGCYRLSARVPAMQRSEVRI